MAVACLEGLQHDVLAFFFGASEVSRGATGAGTLIRLVNLYDISSQLEQRIERVALVCNVPDELGH